MDRVRGAILGEEGWQWPSSRHKGLFEAGSCLFWGGQIRSKKAWLHDKGPHHHAIDGADREDEVFGTDRCLERKRDPTSFVHSFARFTPSQCFQPMPTDGL